MCISKANSASVRQLRAVPWSNINFRVLEKGGQPQVVRPLGYKGLTQAMSLPVKLDSLPGLTAS
jgi:hypothetical protein